MGGYNTSRCRSCGGSGVGIREENGVRGEYTCSCQELSSDELREKTPDTSEKKKPREGPDCWRCCGRGRVNRLGVSYPCSVCR